MVERRRRSGGAAAAAQQQLSSDIGGGVVGGVGVRGGVMYILLAPMGDVLAFTGVVSCPDAMASEIDLFIAPLHKRRCTKALMGCLIE